MAIPSEIVQKGACVGCGACVAVCPETAVKIQQDEISGLFYPVFDFNLCIQCGICETVCPALNWKNNRSTDNDPYGFGNHATSYSAYAVDSKHQISAASGGFTTAFLGSLLKNGEISGAVVSRRVQGNPLDSEVIIARTFEEIMSCKGSIYSPVCFAQVFLQLKQAPEEERLAVVGLPCHIQALSLMMKRFPALRKKVCLSISLVCGHFPTHSAYRYSFKRMGIEILEIDQIYNRGEGWPGHFRVKLQNGTIKKVVYGDDLSWGMVFSSPLFTPRACHVCPDPGGYAADIMVCDAWIPRFKNNYEGVNLVLTKTEAGNELVKNAEGFGDILIEPCPVDDFVSANKRVFVAKTRNHKIAVKSLFGKRADLIHKNIVEYKKNNGFFVRIRLWVYYIHVKLGLGLKLDRIADMLPKAFLFYWKAVSLLKR
jgi:coenzyme F420 hydrogenase subunit beta